MVTGKVSSKAIFPLATSGSAGASGVTAPFIIMQEKPAEQKNALVRAVVMTSLAGINNERPKS